jgi:hypothetical protein
VNDRERAWNVRERARYVAARLDKHHERFLAGESVALLDALEVCATFRVPPPQWAADEFVIRFLSWADFSVQTLDEAFGVTRPKGMHLKARRHRESLRFNILREVARRRGLKQPVDEALFEAVAEAVGGVSTQAIRKIYYETPKYWRK